MQLSNLLFRSVAAAGAAALFAACSAVPLAPPTTGGVSSATRVAPQKGGTFVYTCQTFNSDCLVFVSNKLSVETKKNLKGPSGVVAGSDGHLYIANKSDHNILVFAAGGKKLLAKLSDGGGSPTDVAVYKDSVVASSGTVLTYFSKGAKSPTRTLKDSAVKAGFGVAFDPSGNCYWSYENTSSKYAVDEFSGCKGSPKNLNISTGSPHGIAFDGSANLYFTSPSGSGSAVFKCSGTSSCASTYKGFIVPQFLNFSSKFTDLWVDDTGSYSPGLAYLYEIDISSGKTVATITQDLTFFDPPSGVAPGPGSL